MGPQNREPEASLLAHGTGVENGDRPFEAERNDAVGVDDTGMRKASVAVVDGFETETGEGSVVPEGTAGIRIERLEGLGQVAVEDTLHRLFEGFVGPGEHGSLRAGPIERSRYDETRHGKIPALSL